MINTILILYTFFDSDFFLTRTTDIPSVSPQHSTKTHLYHRLQWSALQQRSIFAHSKTVNPWCCKNCIKFVQRRKDVTSYKLQVTETSQGEVLVSLINEACTKLPSLPRDPPEMYPLDISYICVCQLTLKESSWHVILVWENPIRSRKM